MQEPKAENDESLTSLVNRVINQQAGETACAMHDMSWALHDNISCAVAASAPRHADITDHAVCTALYPAPFGLLSMINTSSSMCMDISFFALASSPNRNVTPDEASEMEQDSEDEAQAVGALMQSAR